MANLKVRPTELNFRWFRLVAEQKLPQRFGNIHNFAPARRASASVAVWVEPANSPGGA